MNPRNLPVNWFDLVVLITLVVGAVVGRKRGMSEELLDLFQWLAMVVVSAMYYEPLGRFIAGYTQLSVLVAYIVTYLFLVLAIRFMFGWVKRMVGEKLVASDLFGRLEYYLGMCAGALRFTCILVVLLAILNARFISSEQLTTDAKMQRDNFGSISFPTLGMLQQSVFKESSSGQFVKKFLNEQLIASTGADQQIVYREGVGKKRERAVDEVLEKK